ncbi:hypothetical protein [Ekhidna sp.]|uniref:hypothetical protein n=1 Tax=Ekhidna sp. TaxID=2608089 RepID=UPI003C79C218
MSDVFDDLKNKWDSARDKNPKPQSTTELIELSKRKHKSVLYSHYGNTVVLTLTLIMISVFFYYVTPFQDLLSKTGVALMVGGLAIRIVIEIISSEKSKKISLIDSTLNTASITLKFYEFRKKIHGPVTFIIVALYTIGFYMLTPEFSRYLEFKWVILMDVSYVLGAIFLIVQIRKGIKEEMVHLADLKRLHEKIEKG